MSVLQSIKQVREGWKFNRDGQIKVIYHILIFIIFLALLNNSLISEHKVLFGEAVWATAHVLQAQADFPFLFKLLKPISNSQFKCLFSNVIFSFLPGSSSPPLLVSHKIFTYLQHKNFFILWSCKYHYTKDCISFAFVCFLPIVPWSMLETQKYVFH